jgi:cell pole-organizing protein PopZ
VEPEPDAVEAGPDDAPEPAAKPAKAARKAAAVAATATVPAVPAAALSGGRTVEEFLAELIRPQVDAWLKANLPELIQKMAADEIARLTGRK